MCIKWALSSKTDGAAVQPTDNDGVTLGNVWSCMSSASDNAALACQEAARKKRRAHFRIRMIAKIATTGACIGPDIKRFSCNHNNVYYITQKDTYLSKWWTSIQALRVFRSCLFFIGILCWHQHVCAFVGRMKLIFCLRNGKRRRLATKKNIASNNDEKSLDKREKKVKSGTKIGH